MGKRTRKGWVDATVARLPGLGGVGAGIARIRGIGSGRVPAGCGRRMGGAGSTGGRERFRRGPSLWTTRAGAR